MTNHEHVWVEKERYENDDRTRVFQECACGVGRRGCCAKRLDFDGTEAWGPVGEWWFGEPMRKTSVYEDDPNPPRPGESVVWALNMAQDD